jgi:hypothetical protein
MIEAVELSLVTLLSSAAQTIDSAGVLVKVLLKATHVSSNATADIFFPIFVIPILS